MTLRFQYDPALPITAHRDEIIAALASHQVLIVCGATGSGKTTQLPKLLLEAERGVAGLIGHTQPRRIAARAIAARLAEELGVPLGDAVGFQVRFTDQTGPRTRIKLMTDGILLRELERDRLLRRYDTLILDEAHERSLNIDFLLGVLKRLLPRRADLKLVITSATIDPGRFARFFGDAPVIEVSGRSYPVEIRYRPLVREEDDETAVLSLPEGVLHAVQELDGDPRGRGGDVLVFLPGEKQIREVADELGAAKLRDTEILPLYARLSAAEQQRIFAAHRGRRIVLSTNVAETSLTVPGVRCVIDSGLARISRYSVRAKVQRLPIEPISQASADQRSGRCGREADGIAIRLYGENEFLARPPFTPPEVLRTNLASVILQMTVLGLGEPDEFPFLDPPDTRQLNDGYRLLQELKAVDDDRRVTALGRQIAALPLDPRLARMLIAASHHGCVAEMRLIAAFLAGQDPRERPAEFLQQADAAHAQFADPRSDFTSILKLWTAFQERSAELSGSQLRKWCRENFLSFVRLREWQELQRQLGEASETLKLKVNTVPADYAELHRAVLTGFLGAIGNLDAGREYAGPRGMRFVIAPGTALGSRTPAWIVAASLVETTRLYARMVAAVEPGWIESAGAHLLKRTYAEPHWVADRGFVAAYETITLYGLALASRRRVNFGNVEPAAAREIFVREALVEGHGRIREPFLAHNAGVLREVEQLEARIRRRDVLIDTQSLCDFYLARIPRHVSSVSAFDKWWRDAGAATSRLLDMTAADVMRRDVPEASAAAYPDQWTVARNPLPMDYRFAPGAHRDGVTLTVPLPLLARVERGELGWLVPGLLPEKVTTLLRALPKAVRKRLVPIPEHAAACVSDLETALATARAAGHSLDFDVTFAAWVTHRGGVEVTPAQVASLPLPEHLRLNLVVESDAGRVVAEGRDLEALRRQARAATGRGLAVGADRPPGPGRDVAGLHRSWDFGTLEVRHEVERTVGGRRLQLVLYPALQDRGDAVALVDLDDAASAERVSWKGIRRLAMLSLPQQVKHARQRFADQRDLVLLASGLVLQAPLAELLVERVFAELIEAQAGLPRDAAAFGALLDRVRGRYAEALEHTERQALQVLREWHGVRQRVSAARVGLPPDLEAQIAALLPADFPRSLDTAAFRELPRYLKAIGRRLDRLAGGGLRDAGLMKPIVPFEKSWRRLAQAHAARHPAATPWPPELARLRWMVEEFRVAQFAQDLKTAMPVSERRLADQLQKAEREAQAAD